MIDAAPNWGDFPTWVSAIGSLGALAAAVIAGIVAWRLLRVEQDRDREQLEARKRTQAEQVAAWPAIVPEDPSEYPRSNPTWGVSIRNGSPLPVYQVHCEFLPIQPGGGRRVVVLEHVPPGDWFLSRGVLFPGLAHYARGHIRGDGADAGQQEPQQLRDRSYVVALRFTDAANRTWHRDRRGVLIRVDTYSAAGRSS